MPQQVELLAVFLTQLRDVLSTGSRLDQDRGSGAGGLTHRKPHMPLGAAV